MNEDVEIRSYHPSDFQAIQEIHEKNGLDFTFPNLNSPLWAVNKVLLTEGKVRASMGFLMVAEANLWLSRESWTDAEGKWLAIKSLDKESMSAARDIGLDGVQCFLPPGYESFGKRIAGIGYKADRPGWLGFSKHVGRQK
jgi:hypothetical protein